MSTTTPKIDVRLTPRQLEVLAGIAYGATALQVANALYVSKRTVDFHVADIIDRLHAHSAIHAVRLAREAEIDVPPPTRESVAAMIARIEAQWAAKGK